MGGKAIWKINNMVWGIDLVEEQLMTVCGIPTQPLIAKHPLANIAEYTVNVHKSGIIENLDFIEVGPIAALRAIGVCVSCIFIVIMIIIFFWFFWGGWFG